MKNDGLVLREPPAPVVRVLWLGVVVLVILGTIAAVGRGVFPADLARRSDPVRQRALSSFHQKDPFLSQRPAELDRFDARFGARPLTTMLHVLPGAFFLVLAPLQFSPRIRDRHLRFHRWSGRVLLLVAVPATLTGLYFGLRMPYGGAAESAAITVFGGLFLFFLTRAFIAIRRGQVARHREWMIRAFAIAIGVSTVRICAALFDVTLTPAGLRPPHLFALSLWTGWAATLAAGELWIRYTRPRRSPAAVPVIA
jgi:uncharacterized membrane protein